MRTHRLSLLALLGVHLVVALPALAVPQGVPPLTIKVEVRGTAVASEDRRPLAGCVARVVRLPWSADPRLPEEEVLRFAADGAGAFAASFDLPLGFCELRLEHAGRCQTGLLLAPTPPADLSQRARVDYGEVALLPGCVVRGRLVGDGGAALADAAIRIPDVKGIAPHLERNGGRGAVVRATSDVEGRFAFARRLPPGRYAFNWELPVERELVSPLHFEIAPGAAVVELELRTRALPCLEGRVEIAGVAREAAPPLPPLVLVATSGTNVYRVPVEKDGRFRVQARPKDPGPVHLEIPATAFERYRHPERVAWGRKDLVLLLEPSGRLELLVVEAGTGAPLEHFAALCVPMEGGRPTREIVWPEAAVHPGGKLTLQDVPVGEGLLHVWVKAATHAGVKQVSFQRKAGETPQLRVEFERKQ
jgi:hypothetical protein